LAHGGGAAAAAAIAHAIKASGVICRVEPEDFINIIRKVDKPLVVYSEGGFFSKNYQYLTSYKGLAFFTKSPAPIQFAPGAEIISASKIWIPG
jgi:hypothetical protein